jgi:hypothetical protein
MRNIILRWKFVLVIVAGLAIVATFLAANPASARTIRTDFDNYNVNCTIVSQTMWVEDGILHIRDRDMFGVVESDGPYHQGTGHMLMNANIDLATGYGNFWGSLEIYPDAFPNGYWAGTASMVVNEGNVGGIARLQGYGELSGLLAQSELAPLTPAELESFAYLCGGNQPVSGAHAVGFVMNPGGK